MQHTGVGNLKFHHSNTPLLHHSIFHDTLTPDSCVLLNALLETSSWPVSPIKP